MSKWRVTTPVTVHGTYYAHGQIVEIDDSSPLTSYRRVHRWELVDVDTPVSQPQTADNDNDLSGLRKAELVALAEERGLPVPAKATRKDLIELLG